MATFGLVHGAWHGAWCWEELIPRLRRKGHRAVAMDLPIDDPQAGLGEYAKAALAALPDDPDLVLVGHSLGASVIPLVAAERQVRRHVYLCPVLRMPGGSLKDQAPDDSDMTTWDLTTGRAFFDDRSSAWDDPGAATAAFFHDCDPETARRASRRLRRQYWRYWDEPNPLESWPPGDRRAIACVDDRIVMIGWARRTIPDRLSVTAIELPGGHSPFLSRPDHLAAILTADL
jgi:pimeloyl-ACP methyl ester carboxylesterase